MATKALALGFALFLLICSSLAQVKTGTGVPKTFYRITHNYTALSTDVIDILHLPPVDNQQMLYEDEMEQNYKLVPLRVGFAHPVANVGMDNRGTWTVDGNTRIWRLKVICPDALGVSVTYSWWHLAPETTFFVYDEARTNVLGPFTHLNNKETAETFSTQPIPGTTLILEYNQPASLPLDASGVQVGAVTHYYRDLFNPVTEKVAGVCNHDVACTSSLLPFDSTAFANEIRSVGMILLESQSRLCSGALINNHQQNCRALFLTAAHCVDGKDVETWLFWFNHQKSSCNANQPQVPYDSISGSTLLAMSTSSDFALLELSEKPPASYQVYYAGWDAVNSASNGACGIHHPTGDVKKISFTDDVLISGNNMGGPANSHWRVTNWDKGTTQGGSSGSPLFGLQSKKIVGQLHGGSAGCSGSSSVGWDEYGKLSYSFDSATGCSCTGGDCCNRLKPLLAGSSGLTSQTGRNYDQCP